MNRFSKNLPQGMQEACAFAEARSSVPRVHAVETPEARTIRLRLPMSHDALCDDAASLRQRFGPASPQMKHQPRRDVAEGIAPMR